MNEYVGEVVTPGLQLREMIVDSKRQHAQRMVVVLGNIFCKDYSEIMWRELSYKLIIGNIKIIVPVGELVLQCISETNESNNTYNGDHYRLLYGNGQLHSTIGLHLCSMSK